LVPLLAAYDVTRVLSSNSLRCVQTLEPFVRTTGWELETSRRLAEEDATSKGLARIVDEALSDERGVVLCTHRPVLPGVFDAFGLDDPGLEPGEMFVIHVRKGKIVTSERHLAR